MGNITIAISVAPAIGPTISGLILQFLPWRFIFVLVLPVALAALVYGSRRLVDIGTPGRPKLDVVSVILSMLGFGGVVYGLSQLGQGASGPGLAVACLVVGLIALLLFGFRQRRLARGGSPLLDLRPFSYRMFSLSLALLCIAMLSLFGVVILLPIYLQTVRGIGSLPTGLILLPGGLAMGLLGPVVGRAFDRYGPQALTVSGAILLATALWRFSRIDADTPIPGLVGLHVMLSIGLALVFTPCFTAALNPLPPSLYSHGSAILATLQQVSGAAGTALLVAIMASRSLRLTSQGVDRLTALNSGIQAAFTVGALISLAALGCAVCMKDRKQESPTAGEAHR